MHAFARKICEAVAGYLQKESPHYRTISFSDPDKLRRHLRPGDVVLVEGNQRVSGVIKYLTQSTWSHAALFVGDALPASAARGDGPMLVEADFRAGVIAVPLTKYATFNTRICRPVGMGDGDRHRVVQFMVDSLGKQYDMKNVVDLMRYLLPLPPLPVRWRRQLLALGSGDPTRAICSTLIAQAFETVRYPILPELKLATVCDDGDRDCSIREIMHIRHHSLYVPRDFDLSPYFEVVKPTVDQGFDHRGVIWAHDLAEASARQAGA